MKPIPILTTLILSALACSLTAPAQEPEPTATHQAPTATEPSSPLPICIVSTGYTEGKLRLRACGSTSCPELAILLEGETLRVIRSGGWLYVTTEGGLSGFIYSKFCNPMEGQ